MRAVLDTNILISGLLTKQGPADLLLRFFAQGKFQMVISNPLMEEYSEVLYRPKFRLNHEKVKELLQLLERNGLLVFPEERFHVVDRDPDDDKVLDAAIEGDAHAIVTGDDDLLHLKEFRRIPILTPRQFLQNISA